MKKNVMFLTGIAMSLMAYSQNQTQITLDEVSIIVPTYTGISISSREHEFASINDYLIERVQYPRESYNLIGTEVVEFWVSATGELTDFKVSNSVSSEVDKEVFGSLMETSGKWIPGSVDGEPVNMKCKISLVFKPNDSYDLRKIARQYQEKGKRKLLVVKDPQKALRYFNQAIVLLPNEVSLIAARSLCKYELGDDLGAWADCKSLNTLLNTADFHLQGTFPVKELNHLAGYAEYVSIPQTQANLNK